MSKKIIVLFILIFSYLISITGAVLVYKNIAFSFMEKSIMYSSLAGLLGSIVYMNRGFYQSLVTDTEVEKFNFEKWIWWYISRPILGLIAGLISFLIIYLALDLMTTTKNQIAFYLLGFLSGYNFHQFVENKINKKIDL